MNAKEIAKFLKGAVKGLLAKDDASTYYIKLDDNFGLYVGWSGGFDSKDDDCLHLKSQPEYCICAKVAEWNPSSIDYEWLYMPWDCVTSDVWDNEVSISPNENYYETAKWLNSNYRNMRTALRKGVITF